MVIDEGRKTINGSLSSLPQTHSTAILKKGGLNAPLIGGK
ncbi:hypothetical protein cce_4719 [Crocosphaera subtropica ATCC 51142]|uniref:Uncharacterized protein n=1 Tax=Crocosphaera subtropica (strain ATCC 51142 / BH68) TaxID=43989 RepID=B1WWD9_CROS5|nr:hypothetical protein cce_4719 [Crocosphaera subtropica ATCC 51142]